MISNVSANLVIKAVIAAMFSLFLTAAANAQCNAASETDLYNSFLSNFKGSATEQKAAYTIGKDYISKFGSCSSDEEKKVTEYIRKWMAKYDGAAVEYDCNTAVNTTPEKAFELCQPYVSKAPDNVRPYLLLVYAGSKNGKTTDAKFKENIVRAAKKALELIAAGKTTGNWIFGKQPDDAVGALNYWAGFYSIENSPSDAATFFVNSARSSGAFAKEPAVFDALARAIYNSEYKTAALEYNTKCSATPASECDALYARTGQILDKVIDAYARAVALSKDQSSVGTTKNYLTTLYKQRHDNSEDGLDKFIAEILSKPLP